MDEFYKPELDRIFKEVLAQRLFPALLGLPSDDGLTDLTNLIDSNFSFENKLLVSGLVERFLSSASGIVHTFYRRKEVIKSGVLSIADYDPMKEIVGVGGDIYLENQAVSELSEGLRDRGGHKFAVATEFRNAKDAKLQPIDDLATARKSQSTIWELDEGKVTAIYTVGLDLIKGQLVVRQYDNSKGDMADIKLKGIYYRPKRWIRPHLATTPQEVDAFFGGVALCGMANLLAYGDRFSFGHEFTSHGLELLQQQIQRGMSASSPSA